MGKTTNYAEFLITAQNKTQRAFAQTIQGMKDLAKQAQLNSPFTAMNRGATLFKASLGGLGIASIGSAVKSTIAFGDNIADLADRTGLSVESVQSLGLVAKSTGIRLDRMIGMFAALEAAQSEALSGNEAFQEAFTVFGLSADRLRGMSVEKVFERIAMTIRQSGGDAKYAAAAHDLVGTSLEKLRPLVAAVGDGFGKLNEGFRSSGEIMTAEQVKRLAEADATLERIWNKTRILSADVITGTIEGIRHRGVMHQGVGDEAPESMSGNIFMGQGGMALAMGGSASSKGVAPPAPTASQVEEQNRLLKIIARNTESGGVFGR